jgi:hypothetical protein
MLAGAWVVIGLAMASLATPAASVEPIPASPVLAIADETSTNDSAPAGPPERVTVHLASGRKFTAAVDERTIDPRAGESRLWLRFGDSAMAIYRPIAWDCVRRVEWGERSLTGDEFRQVVEQVKSRSPPRTAAGRTESAFGRTAKPTATAPVVRSLSVDAVAANWDATPENDGLLVHIVPQDERGRTIAVDGTLTVMLIGVTGERRPSPSNDAHAVENQRVVLQTWTETLSAGAVGVRGATFRLRFQGTDPQADKHLHSLGIVRARLMAPSQGVFEATANPVRLRPIGVLTDESSSR